MRLFLPFVVKLAKIDVIFKFSKQSGFFHAFPKVVMNQSMAYMTSQVTCNITDAAKDNSWSELLRLKLRNMFPVEKMITPSSIKLYEKCVDEIEYEKFFKYFNLPDTFQTWLLVTQLHIWLCGTRLISEKHGVAMRNKLTEVMWHDVEIRMQKVGERIVSHSLKKKILRSMYEQYAAAIIAYDEGLLSDDTVLAASVWRTLFCFHCRDPRLIEAAVLYIRKQLCHMYTQSTEDMMYRGKLSWLPLTDVLHDLKKT